jgi:hypothetical protein
MAITYFSIPLWYLHEVAGGNMKSQCQDNQSLTQASTRYREAPLYQLGSKGTGVKQVMHISVFVYICVGTYVGIT